MEMENGWKNGDISKKWIPFIYNFYQQPSHIRQQKVGKMVLYKQTVHFPLQKRLQIDLPVQVRSRSLYFHLPVEAETPTDKTSEKNRKTRLKMIDPPPKNGDDFTTELEVFPHFFSLGSKSWDPGNGIINIIL